MSNKPKGLKRRFYSLHLLLDSLSSFIVVNNSVNNSDEDAQRWTYIKVNVLNENLKP